MSVQMGRRASRLPKILGQGPPFSAQLRRAKISIASHKVSPANGVRHNLDSAISGRTEFKVSTTIVNPWEREGYTTPQFFLEAPHRTLAKGSLGLSQYVSYKLSVLSGEENLYLRLVAKIICRLIHHMTEKPVASTQHIPSSVEIRALSSGQTTSGHRARPREGRGQVT